VKIKRFISKIVILGLAACVVSPLSVEAAQVTNRSVLLGSSAASAVTTHAVSFTTATAGAIQSISFQYCTTPYSACTTPAGLSTTAATIAGQSGATGFTMVNTANGTPYLTRSNGTSVGASTAVSYTLGNITNPSAPNTEYYIRISTFASTDTTGGATDTGVVVFDTANQIVVSGTMPESLVFCVGTSGTDCTTITGTAVDLGTFSPTATNTGTSVMSASTNASFGYVITLVGATLTSGSNTIPPMGTQTINSAGCSPSCTSSTGTSQFGTNVRANTTPSVGTDVTGTGSGVGSGTYNNVNNFRFFSGDTVASATGPTAANVFTNSYMVNVGGQQAAGVYTATMTYICTATF